MKYCTGKARDRLKESQINSELTMNKRPLKMYAQVGYLFVFAFFRHWDMPLNTLSQTTVVVVPVRRM